MRLKAEWRYGEYEETFEPIQDSWFGDGEANGRSCILVPMVELAAIMNMMSIWYLAAS
jgi:hypothetical protein